MSNIAEYETNGAVPLQGIFCALAALELWLDGRTEFSSTNILLQLLYESKYIENLLVKKCNGLNMEFMRKVWQVRKSLLLSVIKYAGADKKILGCHRIIL